MPKLRVLFAELVRRSRCGIRSTPYGSGTGDSEHQVVDQITRVTTWLAAGAAAFLALALPASWFYFGYLYEEGRLAGELQTHSRLLDGIIRTNPDYWEFAAETLQRTIAREPSNDRIDIHRVLNADGALLAQAPAFIDDHLLRPALSRRVPLLSEGRLAGWLEASTTLRTLIAQTMEVATVAAVLALGVFFALRIVPIRALRRASDRIGFLATHDVLTGLPNRALFNEALQRTSMQVRRSPGLVALLCLNLDRFKDVNDTHGHAAGDLLLRATAKRLAGMVRESDLLARLGGDEFAIVLRDLRRTEDAASVAQRLIYALSEPFILEGNRAAVGCSIGIAVGSADVEPARLLCNADLALLRAKEEGRGTYRFFEEGMNALVRTRQAMQIELQQALSGAQFHLHYQPQISLADRRVIGAEALIRWRHPERGWISPADFIPVAEETRLIHQIGAWVLRTACQDAKRWPRHLKVAVNLSPVQFRQPDLAEMIARILTETGFDPRRLELEITEGVLLQDVASTQETLQTLKGLGVSLAMDDFGTGYSSLSHLRRFPFDKIKIDRSFIVDAEHDANAQAIVRAIVALGGSLSMPVIAEGVETKTQAELLLQAGCAEAQGYLFGRPMPIEDLRARLSCALAA